MLKVKIVYRYLIKEIGLTFIAVLGVFSIIFLSHRFARALAESIAGKISSDVLLIILGFNFLTSLTILIPIALFFSIILALGRLYRDSEMVILLACGVSQWQILKPLMYLSLLLSFFIGILSLWVTPWTIQQLEQIKWESKSIAQFTGMQPGQFNIFQSGQRVFYFETFDENSTDTMRSVIVYEAAHGERPPVFITAEQGRFRTDKQTGSVLLLLENGYQHQGTAGKGDFRITEFKRNAIRLQKKSETVGSNRLRGQNTFDILKSEKPALQAELQWRIAMPIAAVVLVFLAVPLSQSSPRQGRYGKIFFAIIVYLAYNNLLGVARTWIEKSVFPGWAGLWWVHLIFIALAAALLYKANGGQLTRLLQRFIQRKNNAFT